MARLLDLQFSDQSQYVDYTAKTMVAPGESDDEVLFDSLASTTGEQPANLL